MSEPLVIVGPGRLGRSASALLRSASRPHRLIGRGESIPKATLTWLTVPDREIQNAAMSVPPGGIVLHASGASDISILRPHEPAGSLHPLMTFPGPEIALPSESMIPAAISGDDAAVEAAQALAIDLGFTPFNVPGDRALYHAAAVTAGNFASILFIHAAKMLTAAGVSEEDAPHILAPLAIASIKNVASHGVSALTGPITRGDDKVIDAHETALQKLDPETLALYQALVSSTLGLKRQQ
jgi:predicted short-subunit dehydrogenase-like oxidoreductase (DUF2520 family)